MKNGRNMGTYLSPFQAINFNNNGKNCQKKN